MSNVTIQKRGNFYQYKIDRFYYKDAITRERMETIRNIINEFINETIKRIK